MLSKRLFAVMFLLMLVLSGCASVKQVNEGDLFEFCTTLKATKDTVDDFSITINSQGLLIISVSLKEDCLVESNKHLEIFDEVKNYYNNDSSEITTISYHGIDVREIKLSLDYNENDKVVSYDYFSYYYGGDTVYSDDSLNEIDNFNTWYGE